MKSVLISIKPKWCELIASGKKTIEVRKTKPKMEPPFKVYIYCTGGPPYLNSHNGYCYLEERDVLGYRGTGLYCRLNNRVIGEFVCDAIFPISCYYSDINARGIHREQPYTCLTDKEMIDYLGNGVEGYGWNIFDLEIYDTPKELNEFYQKCKSYSKDEWEYDDCLLCENPCGNGGKLYLKRPPQSWCYVEEGGE